MLEEYAEDAIQTKTQTTRLLDEGHGHMVRPLQSRRQTGQLKTKLFSGALQARAYGLVTAVKVAARRRSWLHDLYVVDFVVAFR